MGTKIVFSNAYHPQTNGQVERVNQILEDMLRPCIISFGIRWKECLPYAEFSYNNSYQASLQAAPFEVLYGRKCRTQLNWYETGVRQLFGPDVIQEAEGLLCQRLRGVAFQIGIWAYLRLSPLRGTHHFGITGKLAPGFVGPSVSLRPEDLSPFGLSFQRVYRWCTMCSMCLS